MAADMDTANLLLGYDFFFSGRVVEGNKLGRVLGYPTANLQVSSSEKLIPGDGIYAVEAELLNDASHSLFDGPRLKGMMSIGVRPTIGGGDRTVEVNLFDFDEDIYDRELRVFVKKYLRPEEKFDGLETLKRQLAIDKVQSLEVLRP